MNVMPRLSANRQWNGNTIGRSSQSHSAMQPGSSVAGGRRGRRLIATHERGDAEQCDVQGRCLDNIMCLPGVGFVVMFVVYRRGSFGRIDDDRGRRRVE